MTARFLVAKYVPDVKRMEPRNIGVIVWLDGTTDARFLGEGNTPPRRIGVKDKAVYRKWLTSWRTQLTRHTLEMGRGHMVDKTAPEFLDALREWSRGNFILVDGGEVTEFVGKDELPALTEYLFRELVGGDEAKEKKEHEYQRLKAATSRVIEQAGLTGRPEFRDTEPTWYMAYGLLRSFTCDYVLGPMESP